MINELLSFYTAGFLSGIVLIAQNYPSQTGSTTPQLRGILNFLTKNKSGETKDYTNLSLSALDTASVAEATCSF